MSANDVQHITVCEDTVFSRLYEVGPTCQLFHVFCTIQFSYYSFSYTSTKEPLKVLTSRRLPQLTLVTYYYYYTAWCLIKETILRLWLERTERRTESEGKEWVSMFPGGVKTENGRGEMEHAGVGSTLGHQPDSPLFKLLHNVLPPQREIWTHMHKCSHVHARWEACAQVPLSNWKKEDTAREKSGWFVLGSVPPAETLHNRLTNSGAARTVASVCVIIFECVLQGLRWGQLSPPSPALRGVLAPPGKEKNKCVKRPKGIQDGNNRQVKQTEPSFKQS